MKNKGLIHIYCGDGKGKTTASVGLAVRAAGADKKILFTQFFKDGSSSEIKILKSISNITVSVCEKNYGFYKNMDEKAKESAKNDYRNLFDNAIKKAENFDVLILDEIISSCNYEIIDEDVLIKFLKNKPENLEVVMTGRNPSEKLMDVADYITEMKKQKHPYDNGIMARKGIEF